MNSTEDREQAATAYDAWVDAIAKHWKLKVIYSNRNHCYVAVYDDGIDMLVSWSLYLGVGFTKFGALVDAIKMDGTNKVILFHAIKELDDCNIFFEQAMQHFNKKCPEPEPNVFSLNSRNSRN